MSLTTNAAGNVLGEADCVHPVDVAGLKWTEQLFFFFFFGWRCFVACD